MARLHPIPERLQADKPHAYSRTARQGDRQLIARVEALLHNLDGRAPSFRQAAARLAMSQRTLRRRLQGLGASYGAILRRRRLLLATTLLSDQCLTVEAIAHQLGYADAANFRHAFRRWTGCSPRAYRSALPRVHGAGFYSRAA